MTRYCWQNRICYWKKKKFKRESLVYYNKSQKHEKCLNMVSAKAHSLTYTSTFLAPVNHLQV